jgi:hypothetical protein
VNGEKVLLNTWNLEQPSKVKRTYLVSHITKRMLVLLLLASLFIYGNNVVNLLLATLV